MMTKTVEYMLLNVVDDGDMLAEVGHGNRLELDTSQVHQHTAGWIQISCGHAKVLLIIEDIQEPARYEHARRGKVAQSMEYVTH